MSDLLSTDQKFESLRKMSERIVLLYMHARKKHEFLKPLIHEKKIVEHFNSRGVGGSMMLLRVVLYLDCLQDVANLICDNNDRSASIPSTLRKLSNKGLLERTRNFYVYNDKSPVEENYESKNSLLAFSQSIDKKREISRKEYFSNTVVKINKLFDQLKISELAKRLDKARKK